MRSPMVARSVTGKGAEWRFELPASLEAIEEVCVRFHEWRALHCAGLEPFPSELLLREALTNSVVHGASEDPRRKISCVFRARKCRLLIAVKDDGEGFDWREAFNRKVDAGDVHGRGIEILRRYANSVRFNPSGNSVTLIKRFSPETARDLTAGKQPGVVAEALHSGSRGLRAER